MGDVRNLALMGLGTVGRGVVELLSGGLGAAAGLRIAAVTVANPGKPEHAAFLRSHASARFPLPTEFTPLDRVADLPGIDLVVDVTGGGEEVRDVMVRCLRRGRDVVTANKAVLSRFGREMAAAAEAPGAGRLAYEAAVGGGIPIIRTLRSYLAHDAVHAVAGIINGTSNYILSEVSAGRAFADALAEAIRRGYAEPGGGADVSGEDACHKLVILSRLAYGAVLSPGELLPTCVRGIAGIDAIDFRYARERLGRGIKALAVAQRLDGGRLSFRVCPVMLRADSVFLDVRASHNGILLSCRNAGRQLLAGPGAGKGPTAHAVLSDVLDLIARPAGPAPALPPGDGAVTDLIPLGRHEYEHCYVRFVVRNGPGIVGAIAEAFGRNGMHIHEVLQLDHARDELRALGPLRDGSHRATVDAGEALAFAVTLNRCAFGQVEAVVEQLAGTTRFHNLCPPVILPFEDGLPELAAGA
jgi:homoserine dehydrogenase